MIVPTITGHAGFSGSSAEGPPVLDRLSDFAGATLEDRSQWEANDASRGNLGNMLWPAIDAAAAWLGLWWETLKKIGILRGASLPSLVKGQARSSSRRIS
ncbi:hypothetical protein WOLCODRAFT_164046 [Wolfiporia cocos MD-104 SS10]|uniref:Uncharacterized protein n=1 Tax=Wolfiporia cocos (strain MD-104) TaxID=742152 RepID=A0A2H3JKW0_WOLCO|nr:hypothetical protein WOLCODRAFT_164046 [Wolfiporia cocos MD-104 SS10]